MIMCELLACKVTCLCLYVVCFYDEGYDNRRAFTTPLLPPLTIASLLPFHQVELERGEKGRRKAEKTYCTLLRPCVCDLRAMHSACHA